MFSVKNIGIHGVLNNRNFLFNNYSRIVSCKWFSSYFHRRPLRVVESKITPNTSIEKKSILDSKNVSEEALSHLNSNHPINRVDAELPPHLKYRKLGDTDTTFNALMMPAKSRKQRERSEKIILEGRRLIMDAIGAGVLPDMIFFSDAASLEGFPVLNNVLFYKVQYKKLQMWSDLTTSPGIIGVFSLSNLNKIETRDAILPLTVVCDGIREPGNLGAILRVLVGVGCQRIILTKGCVDLWEPKVLRSACGAHFRIPILKDVEWDCLHTYIGEETNVFLADVNKEYLSNTTDKKSDGTPHQITSLNYSDTNFGSLASVLLVVGGEAEGLSESAYKLAVAKTGKRLVIPMVNDVESLNVAVALGIIVYEIRRQFQGKFGIAN